MSLSIPLLDQEEKAWLREKKELLSRLSAEIALRKETEERLEQVLDDWSRSLELISKLEGEINMFKRKGKKIRQTSSKKLLCVSSDNYDATDDTSLPSFGAMEGMMVVLGPDTSQATPLREEREQHVQMSLDTHIPIPNPTPILKMLSEESGPSPSQFTRSNSKTKRTSIPASDATSSLSSLPPMSSNPNLSSSSSTPVTPSALFPLSCGSLDSFTPCSARIDRQNRVQCSIVVGGVSIPSSLSSTSSNPSLSSATSSPASPTGDITSSSFSSSFSVAGSSSSSSSSCPSSSSSSNSSISYVWMGGQNGTIVVAPYVRKEKEEGAEGEGSEAGFMGEEALPLLFASDFYFGSGRSLVRSLAYSNQGNYVFSGSDGGIIQVWKAVPQNGFDEAARIYATCNATFKNQKKGELSLLDCCLSWLSSSSKINKIHVSAIENLEIKKGNVLSIKSKKEKFSFKFESKESASQMANAIMFCAELLGSSQALSQLAHTELKTPEGNPNPVLSLTTMNGFVWSLDSLWTITEWQVEKKQQKPHLQLQVQKEKASLVAFRSVPINYHLVPSDTPLPGVLLRVSVGEVWASVGDCWVKVNNPPFHRLEVESVFSPSLGNRRSKKLTTAALVVREEGRRTEVWSADNSGNLYVWDVGTGEVVFEWVRKDGDWAGDVVPIGEEEMVVGRRIGGGGGGAGAGEEDGFGGEFYGGRKVSVNWRWGDGMDLITSLAYIQEEVWCGTRSGIVFRIYPLSRVVIPDKVDVSHDATVTSIQGTISGAKGTAFTTSFDCRIIRWMILPKNTNAHGVKMTPRGTPRMSVGSLEIVKRERVEGELFADLALVPRDPVRTVQDINESFSEKLRHLAFLLHQEKHYLPLAIIHSILSVALYQPGAPPFTNPSITGALTPLEEMVGSVLVLHARPDELFFKAFLDELLQVKVLTVVMRETSTCVCVLKCCLRPFTAPALLMIRSLIKFGKQMTPQQVHLLTYLSGRQMAHNMHVDLKFRLQKALWRMLTPSSVPPALCVLCYRTARLVETQQKLGKVEVDGTLLHRWVISAILFLRFIVPLITSFEGTVPTDDQGKGFLFLGKLVLKLCSHSLFPERERGDGEGSGGCLANKVLRDSFEMFDDFCLGVLKRGGFLWERGKNPKQKLNIIVSAPQEEKAEGKGKGKGKGKEKEKERKKFLPSSSSVPSGDGGPVCLSASMPATLPSQLEKKTASEPTQEFGATQEVILLDLDPNWLARFSSFLIGNCTPANNLSKPHSASPEGALGELPDYSHPLFQELFKHIPPPQLPIPATLLPFSSPPRGRDNE